jgi:hypothetical protein
MIKNSQVCGFTLIELIIFIVVGGIFIPMAYIAFLSVARPYVSPSGLAQTTMQAVSVARFLAEFKMEDIAKDPYTNLQGSQLAYVSVERYPGDTEYSKYQWRWIVEPVKHQLNPSGHSTIVTPDPYPRPSYAIGDYIIPPNPNGRSYQVYFPHWEPPRNYIIGNNILSDNGHVYQCTREHTAALPQPTWTPGTGDKIQVDGIDTWVENTSMTPGGPPSSWPLQVGSEFDDGSLHWRERTIYRQITIVVREPNGYEYKTSTVLSARSTVYP